MNALAVGTLKKILRKKNSNAKQANTHVQDMLLAQHTTPSQKKSRYGSRVGQTSSTLTRFIENTIGHY
jgi:hypothetical protein